ncbi:MAG: hypothetical protein K0Q87_3564 [Neobacillus sp.]|nr:hypothetical protein [Neobacillus sp.]
MQISTTWAIYNLHMTPRMIQLILKIMSVNANEKVDQCEYNWSK